MKYYFAADIGGTKTAIGLYDEAYNEIYHGKILTEPSDGCEKLLDKLYGMAGRLFEEYPVAGAGIACPGPLDVSRGVVNNTTTLGWYNVPVRRLFSEKFGVEFALLNDCNAGAYGEYVVRNCKNMAYMSISTGIGGGIIVDGKLYNGQGNAAEFGHLYAGGRHLKCGCGREDCLELYASGTAVESEYFRRTGKRLSGVDIAELANIGDEAAVSIYENVAGYIAEAVVDIQKILDPELVVIGGGVAEAEPFRNAAAFQKIGQYGVKVAFSDQAGKQVLLGTIHYIRDFMEIRGIGANETTQEVLRQ